MQRRSKPAGETEEQARSAEKHKVGGESMPGEAKEKEMRDRHTEREEARNTQRKKKGETW